jgi:hypothetical protein
MVINGQCSCAPSGAGGGRSSSPCGNVFAGANQLANRVTARSGCTASLLRARGERRTRQSGSGPKAWWCAVMARQEHSVELLYLDSLWQTLYAPATVLSQVNIASWPSGCVVVDVANRNTDVWSSKENGRFSANSACCPTPAHEHEHRPLNRDAEWHTGLLAFSLASSDAIARCFDFRMLSLRTPPRGSCELQAPSPARTHERTLPVRACAGRWPGRLPSACHVSCTPPGLAHCPTARPDASLPRRAGLARRDRETTRNTATLATPHLLPSAHRGEWSSSRQRTQSPWPCRRAHARPLHATDRDPGYRQEPLGPGAVSE